MDEIDRYKQHMDDIYTRNLIEYAHDVEQSFRVFTLQLLGGKDIDSAVKDLSEYLEKKHGTKLKVDK